MNIHNIIVNIHTILTKNILFLTKLHTIIQYFV